MTKTELAQNNSALCKALVSLRQPNVSPDTGKFCVTVKKDLAGLDRIVLGQYRP